ncbi:hypothetical protein L1887_15457 [Cichorium endivia]|nr:hypothetical protein L1887_15457 [Cichorium endivia]
MFLSGKVFDLGYRRHYQKLSSRRCSFLVIHWSNSKEAKMPPPKTEEKEKEKGGEKSDVSDYDAYFDMIQSRKTLSS